MTGRLTDRDPRPDAQRLLDELVPPPHFDEVRFSTYEPDPGQPSQQAALDRLREFAGVDGRPRRPTAVPPPAREPSGPPGVYLDGGYGVGKTHLLASLWHDAPAPKAFGTFVGCTNLVGALGFADAVAALSTRSLLCIDEFELDDPGDTVLVSTLLARLVEAGVPLAATSNTLPGTLGEGRFAADDFLREIQGLSAHFQVVRIDGEDYRHRGLPEAPAPWSDDDAQAWADAQPERACDDFHALLRAPGPGAPQPVRRARRRRQRRGLTGVHPLADQYVALRLVVARRPAVRPRRPGAVAGCSFDQLFSDEMLAGGYRKKYLRALSRLTALARLSR